MTANVPGPAPLGDKLRIAFLGPSGTFTKQTVHQVAPTDAILMPITSAPRALAAVRRDEAGRAVIPIENSIEGGVNTTLDSPSHGNPLVTVAGMHIHVVFQLAVLPGTRPEGIRRIGMYPYAWAQCRGWVKKTFSGAIHAPATSTATAAELPLDGNASFDAALCNAVSVNTYGLEALFTGVADSPGTIARFVLVARPGVVSPPTGVDKATTQVALLVNKSDALLTPLEQFSVCGVDLSRIESRPSDNGLGSYTFSIDTADHIREECVQAALVGLHRYSPGVHFVGSYPRVDGVRALVTPGTTDGAFRTGRAWAAGLLHGEDDMGEAAGNAPSQPLA